MFEVIIVPMDGSELGETALPIAKEIQQKFNSHLILVRAVEPESHRLAVAPAFFETPAATAANVEIIQKAIAEEREDARSYLAAKAQELGGDVEALLVEDTPADAIVNLSKERNAGLIVMSSHGRGGLGRLVFGSVADAVLKRSTTPVLLVRHSEG